MGRKEHIERLNNVYSKYYCNDGKCKYFPECKRTIPNNDEKFIFDRANVGIEYGENPELPKIVVVGLEGLGKSGKVEEIECPSETAYNSHYKGVRYILAYILSKLNLIKKNVPGNALKRELFKYSDDTIKNYTLLNCYKCAFANKAQGLPHTDEMKLYCQRILIDEIRALEPDFLIIQIVGNRPKDFELHIAQMYGRDCQHIFGNKYTGIDKLTRSNNTPMILIWTYHGSGNPSHKKRSWTNDSSCEYINSQLNPVLEKAVEAYIEDHVQ